jgi:hypoxanthine phosphoribosyltransferase
MAQGLHSGNWSQVVGVLNGGALSALVVANILKLPICWCRVNSYAEQKKKKALKVDPMDLSFVDFKGKEILVVDDIIDTRSTMETVIRILQAGGTSRINIWAPIIKVGGLSGILDNYILERGSFLVVPQNCWVQFPWEK